MICGETAGCKGSLEKETTIWAGRGRKQSEKLTVEAGSRKKGKDLSMGLNHSEVAIRSWRV